jgi:hypothetical protein
MSKISLLRVEPGKLCGHTGNHIARIHRILVFDESEAIHEFDLGDLSSAMGVEVGLDISLGSCRWLSVGGSTSHMRKAENFVTLMLLTIARKVAQIQSS